ncbi:nucleoid-associated protein [Youhaiella tibetensis]|uniref:Nucleoid-associated protein FNA67_02745 n=1 Tax=Paradevosia tibetensis TaxID=1447062 RepID=A0A5B9DL95_9HYPH|nr:YbaB/EbfC family nucleoid-associated protein [Youhaiella tibetensis]AKR58306.1 nucleoid-associated protein [Devosia sp. H5989]QEE19158.1 YbaB/EbfC family nucleoid-associated protein [Youhaiella tibetensis]GGF35780.1 nucleoid-associated protein [Youhaiella tibetensis]
MADFLNMMKKAQEMQAKMQQMQAELGNLVVEGQSGGGLVKVSLSGKGELKGLKIDPSLLKADEGEILEDLIVAAHADAKSKAEVEMNSRMQEVTAGLPLPPGMKFPF